MTEFLAVQGGKIAYEVTGVGLLIVLVHGIGDSRAAYRFMVPALVKAGYRVANMDIRGCGESSVEWSSYKRTAIAGDIVALVRQLGGPAVLVGHSIAGGAVTIAAATAPELVTGVVELAPFTRKQQIRISDLRVTRYRNGTRHLMATTIFGSERGWFKYLDVAYPGVKPADWVTRNAQVAAMLKEPGRMKVLQSMGKISPADAGEQLGNVVSPVLIIEGSEDPDWASPRAEGQAILSELPEGLGRLEIIEGAGHYPHAQYPEQTVALVLQFLSEVATARA